MTRRPVRAHAAALVVLYVTGIGAARAQETDRPEGTGTIEVTITGMQNDRGQLLINVFLSSDGFPSDPERAFRAVPQTIDGQEVHVVFEDIPAGRFAIAAFHDENENFKLDTNFLGIPRERWGVSRGARGLLGPPSFDSAVLVLEPDEVVAVPIELR